MVSAVLSLLAIVGCHRLVHAATYELQDNYVGSNFLSGFEHQAIADPTHGRTRYVDEATARSKNLTFVSDNSLILRADYATTLDPNGPGRDSVRIQSHKTYTTHVAIFDVRHMPQGCGTWPAAWETLGVDWPNAGEVDILEGINDQAPNHFTLHTTAGCSIPQDRMQTGTTISTNCDWTVNGNQGCSVSVDKGDSYGPSFNNNGGGIYAMERRNDFIRIFFWPRDDASVPYEVRTGARRIRTDNWGTPVALFPNAQCDLSEKFGPNNIIINLTFCGDWAGNDNLYSRAGCPGQCVDYVNNNPYAFRDAYWDIASLRVYV